jgi:hypothetical protein
MPDRAITGTLYRHSGAEGDNAKLTWTLLTDTATRPGEALPVWSRVIRTDADGAIPAGFTLEVPDTGAWLYRLKIESNTALDFYLEDGAALMIDEIVTLAGQAGSEAGTPAGEFLLDIYDGAQDADAGQVLTADGAGSASWEDAAAGGIPLISPAVAGNLVVQSADGTLEDAGIAADDVAELDDLALERTPDTGGNLTAIKRRHVIGIAPNALGLGAVDLQYSRSGSTQTASGDYAGVGSGGRNHIASGAYSGVGNGGSNNTSSSFFGGVGNGGTYNIASGDYAGVGNGGNYNIASGDYAGVLDGSRRASAAHDGAKLSSDSQNTDFDSIIADEFAVRARGGARFVTATDGSGVPTKTVTIGTDGWLTYTSNTEREGQRAELGLGTAAVLDAGATGANVVEAATVDDARAVLGLAALDLPGYYSDHRQFVYSAADVVSGGNVTRSASNVVLLQSTATAGGRVRAYVNSTGLLLNETGRFVSWDKRITFGVTVQRLTTSATGYCNVFFGRESSEAFGSFAGNFVGFGTLNGRIVALYAARASVLTTIAVSSALITYAPRATIHIASDNGTVNWYFNGVLLGSTAAGPNLTEAAGTISMDISNGGTATNEYWVLSSWSQG